MQITTWRRGFCVSAIATAGLLFLGQALAAPEKAVAVLGIELLDTSPGVTSEREKQRLGKIVSRIREVFEQDPAYAAIDAGVTDAAVATVRESQYLHDCNGCEVDLGRSLGADWVAVGWIQKVSNLILNLNVIVKDVETGADVAAAFVDLRGNSDESWLRATDYLLDNLLLERLAAKR